MKLTEENIRKLNEKLNVIERLKKGERKRDIASDPKVNVSENTVYTWWKAYRKEGIEGLIDKRKGVPYKTTNEIQEFILQEGTASTPGKKIVERVKTTYGVSITDSYVNKILAKFGLSNPVGRPKRKHKMTDGVGAFFLKGADLEMGLSDVVLDVAKDATAKKTNPSLRITHSKETTISHKNNTLLYMPVFGLRKPWDLQKYHKRCLGIISESGRRYKYKTMEMYLGDLEKLGMEDELSKRLARCYQEVWYLNVSLENGDAFYIDGHMKALWSSKNIPKGYHTTRNRAMKCVEQFFIHGSRGHPLILETCAGDTHLTKEVFKLIDAFEEGVGSRMVEVSVFDREGLCVDFFREFERKKRFFITLLRSDQYKSEDSFEITADFETLDVDEDGRPVKLVADAKFELKYEEYDKEGKRHEKRYPVRVALVKKIKNSKLIPVITNIRHKNWTPAKIARTYFDRWPNQENPIKGMIYGVNLDVNHGYGKIEVENRVVDRKKQELEKSIAAKERKISSAEDKLAGIKKRLENVTEKHEGRMSELDEKKAVLKSKVIDEDDAKRKERLFVQIGKVDERIVHFTKKHHGLLERLRIKEENIVKYKEGLLAKKEGKEKELASLDLDKKLYEAKTSKDMVMSNFKVMLNNMHIYARDHYFSEEYHNREFETMCDFFYRQGGYIKVTKDCYDVVLSSYDDPKLHEEAKRACDRFNERDIRTKDGRKIRMGIESITF